MLVRAIGRIESIDDLKRIAVPVRNGRPVALSMLANVVEAPQLKRGDASAFVRESDDRFSGGQAVVLTVSKQPGADTRGITQQIQAAIREIKPSLSAGIRIESLYAQEHFIDRAIENVMVALRDGGVLVVLILFLFLMNFRTTFIVCLVFLPLFALSGMEGRLFSPLGVAYVVSILSSLVVSLTVTPVLSYWLLPSSQAVAHKADGILLRILKNVIAHVIRFSLRFPVLNIGAVLVMVAVAAWSVTRLDRDFLPPFNEGAIQLNVLLPPGNSLATTISINKTVEQSLVVNRDTHTREATRSNS